jgi:hypothetical protein
VEVTYADLHRRLSRVEEMLSSSGVTVHGASRFRIYRRTLEKLYSIDADATLSNQDRESLYDALLECNEFVRSIPVLVEPPEVQGWSLIAAKALGGNASGGAEKDFTPARDAQFELLVAAMLRRSGFLIRLAEPDIHVELTNGSCIGIAAKRVKSLSKLASRISEGSKQIAKSQLHGLLAVHLSFFTKTMTPKTNMPTAMDALRDEVRRFTLDHMGDFYRRIDKRQTFGIMMFSTKLAQLVEQPQLTTASSVYVTNLCDPSDKRLLLLDSLTEGLDGGSKTWFQ